MKTTISKLTLLLLFFVCYSCEINNIEDSSTSCYLSVSDPYKYPVVPGTDEWRKITSINEAFQVCQLPEKTLKSISTQGLIDAIVHSPMFTNHYLLSSSPPVETWHKLYSKLNAIQELISRNGIEELITYYKTIDFDCIKSNNEDNINDFERLMGIEFLFTEQEILNKINHQKKQELVQALLSNYKKKTERWSVIVPIAWVMFDDNYQPMKEYYQNNTKLYEQSILLGYIFFNEQVGSIISMANNFIK